MADIFISYARSTAENAQSIAAELRSIGYEVWLDDQLPTHRAYAEVIEEHLAETRVVLVIWSHDAAKSTWVRAEAEVGLEAHKLVQLTIDGTLPPIPFNQIECASVVGWESDPNSHGWRKVLTSIQELSRVDSRGYGSGLEMRHITLLSCNLTFEWGEGSQNDPELWHDIFTQFRKRTADSVNELGGHIAKSIGNNVVVYFGYPDVQEDAVERAVHAGLAIVAATHELDELVSKQGRLSLSVQVGIHSGKVVVSLAGDESIVGEVPDIATEVQQYALPNSVLITGAVKRLVADNFSLEKFVSEDSSWVQPSYGLYRAELFTEQHSRELDFNRAKMTPFVGREDELQFLTSRWFRVREGDGQMVLLIGEPGIGKTRLIDEFISHLEDGSFAWLQGSGERLNMKTPFHAVAQALERALSRIQLTGEQRLSSLEKIIASSEVECSIAIPLLVETLNLNVSHNYPPSMLTPDQQRQKVLEILSAWLFGASLDIPLVFVIEDLHWLDPSTLELVQILIEQGASSPLLLLCTARPEFKPPWQMRAHHAQISVDRLSRSETKTIVENIKGDAKLGKVEQEALIERADGVPLFAEELAQLMTGGGLHNDPHLVPMTLQDSLSARLDRLGTAKRIAQLGAVIGRNFSYELLLAVSEMREADVRLDLKALVDAELVFVRGRVPKAHFEFKHALIQDAAYGALIGSNRREIHCRVAEVMMRLEPMLEKDRPEILAAHWTGAGEAEKAIDAWTKASRLALSRNAYVEACESLRQALTLLAKQPETAEREELTLRLRGYLVGALQITCGYSADETRVATREAQELAEKIGDVTTQLKHAIREWSAASSAGDYQTSGIHADKMLTLAHVLEIPRELGMAYMAVLTQRLRTGDLMGAEQAFSAGERYFDSEPFIRRYGSVPQTFGNAAINALIIGNEAEARRRIEVVHVRFQVSENPYELAFLANMSGLLALMMGRPDSAEKLALDCIERSRKGSFPQFVATSSIVHGRALAEMGRPEDGLVLIRQGLAQLEEVGNRSAITRYLNWFAATQAQCGSMDLALETIEKALTTNREEISYRAESLRYRAEFRLQNGDKKKALVDLQDAVELAEAIGAGLYRQRAINVLNSVI